MKIHLLYSWINLRGANPPYSNNRYIITYVINLKNNSLKIRGGGGGGLNPPNFPTTNSGGGGYDPPTPPPPSLAPL